MASKLHVKDKGLKALLKRLEQPPVSLTVGVHEKDNEPYERGVGQEATTANIASFHEYGTEKMPARPWLGPVVQKNRDRYLDSIALVEQAFLMGKLSKNQRYMKLSLIGEKITSDVLNHIDQAKFAPLAESTIMARRNRDKGSIKILQDTGQFIQSISYEVKD